MTEDQIKHMVSRFLGWRLPANFNPDGGVRFEREVNGGPRPEAWWPNGTNVFDAQQAEAMVRHMLDGAPAPDRTGYLIERYYNGQLHYWNGRPLDSGWVAKGDAYDLNKGAWTDKPGDAVWFGDEGSAAVVLSWGLGGVGRVAQHMVIQKADGQ